MATKFILTHGVGFAPGSVKYVPTLGFTIAQVSIGPVEGSELGTAAIDGHGATSVAIDGHRLTSVRLT